jgi:hypothetical protein
LSGTTLPKEDSAMAVPGDDTTRGPALEASDARQSRRSPGAFAMLAVSTVLGVVVVAIVWAFFAGPLHHAHSTPQVQSPAQAAGFHEGPPQAKANPSPRS